MNASNDRETKQDAKKLEKINLIPEEWRCIEKFLEILSPFAELTEILEGHKYTTMSYIHPGITKLKKLVGSNVDTHDEDINFDNNDNAFEEHLFEEPEEEDESHAKRKIRINTPVDTKELINKVKKNLYQALEKYYEVVNTEALVASLLDPRWKNLSFATPEERELVIFHLKQHYNEAKSIYIQESSPNLLESQRKKQKINPKYKVSLFEDEEELLETDNEDKEVERYLAIAQISKDQSSLKWWDANQQ
ncbi:hypothetical protein RhiirA4_531967 [Rhizophagus irregularis]|uniref:Zinc finger bed domain-containing protein 1-like n=1 Tax=Rhizophagus irregularis TaxID=588596 RepID=A0A2I1GWP2_9GLOM|nr:hypothetical protein RhiirA4_531967 [Rhizophagus irregularis]